MSNDEELDANWISFSAAAKNIVAFLEMRQSAGQKEKAAPDAELAGAAVAIAREEVSDGFDGRSTYRGIKAHARSSEATSSSNGLTVEGSRGSGEEHETSTVALTESRGDDAGRSERMSCISQTGQSGVPRDSEQPMQRLISVKTASASGGGRR